MPVALLGSLVAIGGGCGVRPLYLVAVGVFIVHAGVCGLGDSQVDKVVVVSIYR